jgi:NTE family protein
VSSDDPAPQDGVALCLSGGGYRAMLFHLGTFLRLNEAGWLKRLDRISSVSGGSIAAAALAVAWAELDFGADGVARSFDPVTKRIRRIGGISIDVKSALSALAIPGESAADRAARHYTQLLGDSTLQDLPATPDFILCSTNLGSGVLWRFCRAYMGDYRVGRIASPRTPLAHAVAASAAFPPVLSPLRLKLPSEGWIADPTNDLDTPAMRREAVLADGGVYDNLGLQPVWNDCRTVLISDGGGSMGPSARVHGDWLRQTVRVLDVIDNQVRALRKQESVQAFIAGERKGAYWGIRTDIAKYRLTDALPCPSARTLALSHLPTRLNAFDDERQERLINWGYAVCDAALRAHVDPALPAPAGFPFPARGI